MFSFSPVSTTIKGHVFSPEIKPILPERRSHKYGNFLNDFTTVLKTGPITPMERHDQYEVQTRMFNGVEWLEKRRDGRRPKWKVP